MAADEQARHRAEAKITELERRRDRKRQELQDLTVFHAAAWAQYGSELCPGEMMRDERELHGEITSIEYDIELLRKFVVGDGPRTGPAKAADLDRERLTQLLG